MAIEIYLGNPPAYITDWIKDHQQLPAAPSPYFEYDSNRVITRLYQGSPNIGNGDGWEYGGGPDLTDSYALGIDNSAFADVVHVYMGESVSIGVTGSLTFPNVEHIGYGAFYVCQGLTSVTLGSNIQSIAPLAFQTESNPITLTIRKTIAEVQALGVADYDSDRNVPYSEWGLPSGSTIVCTDGTITIE